MRLEWLEDILAVAETGSLLEAAERRHLSPSAFSRRIQGIEDHVGVELFDRTRKPIQLRPAAAEQRERIAELARQLRRLREDLRRGAAANRLVLASQHALTAALTPGLIRSLSARYPEMHVRLRSANLGDCFGLLLAGQADIALAYRVPGEEHPISADFIETMRLGEDRLLPVLGSTEAKRLRVRAEEELPVIAYPGDVFLGQVMERHVLSRLPARRHAVPRVETALTLAALELASQGIGVAWVPASLAGPRLAQGVLVDLSDELPSCELEVTAVRLAGQPPDMAAAIWAELDRLYGQG